MSQKTMKCKASKPTLPHLKGESMPSLVSAVSSDLSSLGLSLTKDVSEEEEMESRDMAEAELELDSSPLEVLSEASVGGLGAVVLNSAATFCCGGQEAESKMKMELLHNDDTQTSNVKSQTTGTIDDDDLFSCFHSLFPNSTSVFFLFSSTANVISRWFWESDVCAAAGSAARRKEKRCRRSSSGVNQNFTAKGCMACPFTREVQ